MTRARRLCTGKSAVDRFEDLDLEKIIPPSPIGLIREGLGLVELAKFLWRFPDLARQPRGNGETVLVLPGYGTDDLITTALRTYLKYLGYLPLGWGLGRNDGRVRDLVGKILKRVAAEYRRTGRPVKLIGWSLGGFMAREVARERPDRVERIITLGSPVVGGPKYTVVAGNYRKMGYDLDAIAAEIEKRNQVPLDVPVTAIYSKRDYVVAWQACIDRVSGNVEHIEVRTTHLGLGFSPDVYRIIARRLAKPVRHPGKQRE